MGLNWNVPKILLRNPYTNILFPLSLSRTLQSISWTSLKTLALPGGRWRSLMMTFPAFGPTASKTAWPASSPWMERKSTNISHFRLHTALWILRWIVHHGVYPLVLRGGLDDNKLWLELTYSFYRRFLNWPVNRFGEADLSIIHLGGRHSHVCCHCRVDLNMACNGWSTSLMLNKGPFRRVPSGMLNALLLHKLSVCSLSAGGWDTCIPATGGASTCLSTAISSTGTTGERPRLSSSPSDVWRTCSGIRGGVSMCPPPRLVLSPPPTLTPPLTPPPSPSPPLTPLPPPFLPQQGRVEVNRLSTVRPLPSDNLHL